MTPTPEQRAELIALAETVRNITRGCGSQRSYEQLCVASDAIPALLSALEEAEAKYTSTKSLITTLDAFDAIILRDFVAENWSEFQNFCEDRGVDPDAIYESIRGKS